MAFKSYFFGVQVQLLPHLVTMCPLSEDNEGRPIAVALSHHVPSESEDSEQGRGDHVEREICYSLQTCESPSNRELEKQREFNHLAILSQLDESVFEICNPKMNGHAEVPSILKDHRVGSGFIQQEEATCPGLKNRSDKKEEIGKEVAEHTAEEGNMEVLYLYTDGINKGEGLSLNYWRG
ncbi:hypothetical protein U1Q18_014410 [Sarracenia purpurea var. burkii]